MKFTLFRKLLRDARVGLIVTALLLAAFQCLWAKITSRILGELSPYFTHWLPLAASPLRTFSRRYFKVRVRSCARFSAASTSTWSGRWICCPSATFIRWCKRSFASGRLAGRRERWRANSTAARWNFCWLSRCRASRLILAHLSVDLVVIPILCLSLWAGTCLGTWLVGPIHLETAPLETPTGVLSFKLGPIQYQSPIVYRAKPESPQEQARRLHIDLAAFGPCLWAVGGLLFAISGYTMAISACGRYRWRSVGPGGFRDAPPVFGKRGRADVGRAGTIAPLDDLLLLPTARDHLGQAVAASLAGASDVIRRRRRGLCRGVAGLYATRFAGAVVTSSP